MKKLMHNTVAAAGFAALLLTGACASTHNDANMTSGSTDDTVHVTQSGSVAPAPGVAKVDSSGNIYASSAAGAAGNSTASGTNTNVNVVPERSSIDLSASRTVESTTLTTDEAIADEANARGQVAGTSVTTGTAITGQTSNDTSSSLNNTTTTTRSTTVNAPMTSSSQTDTQSTTMSTTNTTDTDTTATTTTSTRTRMRKD